MRKKRIYFSTGKSTIDVRGPVKADKDKEEGYSLHDLPSLNATSELCLPTVKKIIILLLKNSLVMFVA